MSTLCAMSTGGAATSVSLGGGLRLPPRYRPDVNAGSRVRLHRIRSTPIDSDNQEEGYEVVAQVGDSISDSNLASTSTKVSVASNPSFPSIPPNAKVGGIAAGAVGVFVVLSAGIRSMWIHRNDKNLHTLMKQQKEELTTKLEQVEAEFSEKLEKREWEYAQKAKARDSETRAREREIREALQDEYASDLAERMKQRVKEVTDELNMKHAAEMANLEMEWRERVQEKQKEVDSQKANVEEFKQQLGELRESQRGMLRREREFEKKVQKYDNAMKAVAPGGTVDTLRKKITQLEREAKDLERELKKWKPATVSVPKPFQTDKVMPAKLSLIAAGTIIPHDEKKDTGGEDAFFVTRKGHGAMAVADGVGAWSGDGVDPAKYPQEFMTAVGQKIERLNGRISGTLEILRYAYDRVKIPGSATTIVATLKPDGELEMANVGDCGVRVIRNGKCVFATKPHLHEFNMPYQLGCETHLEDTDHPSDAEIYHFKVQEGDVVVMGSDGLFDNVWDDDLATFVEKELNGNSYGVLAKDLSNKIAEIAHENAQSETLRTPWAVEEAAAGVGNFFSKLFPKGGKMDDCTVLVGLVRK